MTTLMAFVVSIILIALIFDYINGFHDAANSIATVVSTRVLSPGLAVMWAAFFNFAAFAIFGTRVAKTIGGDLIHIDLIGEQWRLWALLSGLVGAITWNLITWYYGLPSSSSHALVGGYAGAAVAAHRGVSGLFIQAGWIKTVSFIFISPLIGVLLGFFLMARYCGCFGDARRIEDKVFTGLSRIGCAIRLIWRQRRPEDDGIIAAVLVCIKPSTQTSHFRALRVFHLSCGNHTGRAGRMA
jgi:PiT family inorganic phosphate transporter